MDQNIPLHFRSHFYADAETTLSDIRKVSYEKENDWKSEFKGSK